MTAYDFSLVKNTSIAFTAASDSINLGAVNPTTVTFVQDGADLEITIGSDTVTLQNTTMAQLTTGNATFGSATNRGILAVGDDNVATTSDETGNVISMTAGTGLNSFTAANQQHSASLIYGRGGNDLITVGNGNNVVFGGTGLADSTDGADTITLGTGANTVYGNAGADTVNIVATTAGTTTTLYMGIGDDTVTDGATTPAGNVLVYGNTGADNISVDGQTGDATIYGGNGLADSTDGSDTIAFGVGGATVYGNSGNDSISGGATVASKTLVVYAGLGNDSFTAGNSVDDTGFATIFGNSGADTINHALFDGNSTIYGGNGAGDSSDGDDNITSGTGNNTIYANAGNDQITLTALATATKVVTVYAGAGNDTITSSANHTDLAKLNLYGNGGSNVYNLTTNSDADFLIADFTTSDVVNVTTDATSAAAMKVTNMGSSPEILLVDGDANNAYNATGDERIVFSGFSGDFNGTRFNIGAGKGDLITNYSGTAATITGTAGEGDLLISGTTGDTLTGGETAAGAGVDRMIGNAGDDTFSLAAALVTALDGTATSLEGGEGTDTLLVSNTVAVTLQAADFNITRVTSMEKIKFSDVNGHNVTIDDDNQATWGLTTLDASALTGANAITISDNTDFGASITILTGAGADTVTRNNATAFSDTVSLGGGADTFNTILAQITSGDTFDGGAGTDTMVFSTAGAFTDAMFTNFTTWEAITLADGENTVESGAQMDEAGINVINGSALTGTNSIIMTANSSTENMSITGGAASDTIFGGSGADTIFAGLSEGASGSASANIITLGAGANVLRLNQTSATEATDVLDWLVAASSNKLELANSVFTDLAAAGAREFNNTAAALNATNFDNDGDDDTAQVVIINDQEYATEVTAWAAIEAASTEDANDEILLIFVDSDDYAKMYYDTDLSDGMTGATLIGAFRDIDTVAEIQSAFTGTTTSITNIDLYLG